jgi:hypothetical protein
MSSIRRLALLLVLASPAVPAILAQSSSSNPTPDAAQQPAATQSEGQTQGQISVQARIKARREQRRAAAIHDSYSNLYEFYFGMGYLRFEPGAKLQRAHEYAWDAGLTRYFSERLGVTVDGRGYYGTAWVYDNQITNSSITHPAITEYSVLGGPVYRFYLQPKYAISGRVMGGMMHGQFSSDTSGNTKLSTALGLWPDAYSLGVSAAMLGDYSITPKVALRIAPEYYASRFGSKMQGSLGFTAGIAYRFGKQ